MVAVRWGGEGGQGFGSRGGGTESDVNEGGGGVWTGGVTYQTLERRGGGGGVALACGRSRGGGRYLGVGGKNAKLSESERRRKLELGAG